MWLLRRRVLTTTAITEWNLNSRLLENKNYLSILFRFVHLGKCDQDGGVGSLETSRTFIDL